MKYSSFIKMDLKLEILVVLVCIVTMIPSVSWGLKSESKQKSGRGRGSMWWGLAKIGEPNNISPLSTGMLYLDPAIHTTLRRKQRRLVQDNQGVLKALVNGANLAISECQHQFRNRRWNCSTRNFLRGKNLFGKIVDRGCRETAFLYAITSAAVTYSVARACSEGTIESCTCDYSHQTSSPQPTDPSSSDVVGVREWEWGGCSDNIQFGLKFAREFVDTGERGRNLREKMNLHNNEAGRALVQAEMRKECKCHGMSGSCAMRTCWMRLAPFRTIGDKLKDRFDGASRVMVTNNVRSNGGNGGANGGANGMGGSTGLSENSIKHHSGGIQSNNIASSSSSISKNAIRGRNRHHKKDRRYNFQLKPFNPDHKPPERKDLVYFEPSPGFCERNPRLGIQGTHGRQCNETSMGVDGCDLLCCGRGYRTQEITVVERCYCRFHWCCQVKCQICRNKKTIHTCL